ncbi:unnamed protein product, partial [Ectocarpus sp. 12 AP-2014]
TSSWRRRISDAGLRHAGLDAASWLRRRPRRSSTGGIGGSFAVRGSLCVQDSSESELNAYDDEEELCEDWQGAISVDPDAIELALPPRTASSITEGLSFVGFEPLELDDVPQEAVQARTWGDQANLTVGVRYGHSAEIGSRRVMEDRTVVVADIFKADATPSFRSRSEGFFPSSTILSRNSSSPSSSAQDEAARRRF